MLPASGPNASQIEYWNQESGPKWVSLETQLDEQISAHGLAVMDREQLRPGARVLDVGCGCGQTTLQLAERVGPAGEAVGIDISAVMLERARERAQAAGVSNARFENRDAQTVDFAGQDFDLVFSRFGVMFFADPEAAFANLRSGLAPGGRLAFACWQGLDRNPWMQVPLAAALRHLPPPEPPAPGAPGPFSFADPEHVRRILTAAGFGAVELESYERELLVGGRGTLDQAVDFALRLGPAAAALRTSDGSTVDAVRKAVNEALGPYVTSEGVRIGSAAWLVTATG